jgi:hypothetical protein
MAWMAEPESPNNQACSIRTAMAGDQRTWFSKPPPSATRPPLRGVKPRLNGPSCVKDEPSKIRAAV